VATTLIWFSRAAKSLISVSIDAQSVRAAAAPPRCRAAPGPGVFEFEIEELLGVGKQARNASTPWLLR
jgi:hypothetical protein